MNFIIDIIMAAKNNVNELMERANEYKVAVEVRQYPLGVTQYACGGICLYASTANGSNVLILDRAMRKRVDAWVDGGRSDVQMVKELLRAGVIITP
jgi:hypothetical protein